MKLIVHSLLALFLTTTGWCQFGQIQEARVPNTLVAKIYRPQKRSATCWAACNSMLLAAEGIDSSEEDQMQRMRPFLRDGGENGAGAHFLNASQALRGMYGNRRVNAWFIDRRMPPPDPAMNAKFVLMIQQGKPVMVATPQHGMVAIGVKFAIQPNGFYALAEIEVLDPNPKVGGSRVLPPDELQALFGFMSIEPKTGRIGRNF